MQYMSSVGYPMHFDPIIIQIGYVFVNENSEVDIS
jgi:hypothetical protein